MCDTNYLIELSKRNDLLIDQLKDNLTTYNEIIIFINQNKNCQYVNTDLISFYQNLIEKAEQEVAEVTLLNENIRKEIHLHCEHEYTTDIIDTDYDRSKTICYCTICELNKNE